MAKIFSESDIKEEQNKLKEDLDFFEEEHCDNDYRQWQLKEYERWQLKQYNEWKLKQYRQWEEGTDSEKEAFQTSEIYH